MRRSATLRDTREGCRSEGAEGAEKCGKVRKGAESAQASRRGEILLIDALISRKLTEESDLLTFTISFNKYL